MSTIFDEVELVNFVTYKKAVLPLSKHPVTMIRGRNSDRRSKNSSNASGKSLLCSAIPTVRYGAPPTDQRKRSAGIMHSKGSEVHLRVRHADKLYELVQFQKGRSIGYDVVADGKKLEYRESKEAFARIGSIIPITEQQFYSFVYLDARRSHPLHIGTVAQRFEFFEQAFNLDIYDRIAKKISEEYNTLKFQVQQLKEAESEYALRESEIPKQKIAAIAAKREDLVVRADKVRSKVDKYLKELRRITAYMTLAEGIEPGVDVRTVKQALKEAHQDEKALAAKYRESVEYYTAIDAAKKAAKTLATLKAEIAESKVVIAKLEKKYKFKPGMMTPKSIETSLAELRSNTAKWNAELADALEMRAARAKAWEEVQSFDISDKYNKYTAEKIKAGMARQRQQIVTFQESLDTITEHSHDGDSKCPTCFQPLSVKARKAITTTCKEGIKAAKHKLAHWRKVSEYLSARERHAALPMPKQKPKDLRITLKKAIEFTADLCDLARNTQIVHDAKVKISFLPKKSVEARKIASPEVYEDALKGLRKRIKDMESQQERLTKIAALDMPFTSYDEAKQRYDELQAYIDKYQPLLNKAQAALQSMTVKLTRAESLTAELEKLSNRIDKHKDAAADYKVYEALREAYGAKGLRKMRTATIAAEFEQNLNRHASLLFAEPITFKILIGNNKFDILAERNGKAPADVRTLSGSEGRCFVLLTLLALITVVPANARTNLLVLDEMESLLDVPSRELMVNEFIPVLNTVIPNIVVITSHSRSEFSISGSVGYTVIKKNGESRLVADKSGATA